MVKLRKEQHRVAMVEFRKNRKMQRLQMQNEHRSLEHEMELFVGSMTTAASRSTTKEELGKPSSRRDLLELILEREMLWRENITLRRDILRRDAYLQVVVDAEEAFLEREALLFLPSDLRSGWRVHFGNNVPSFHFHPFTHDEYVTGMKKFDAKVAHAVPSTSFFGNFLGWDVCRAPLITNNNAVFARIQSKKCVNCPIDAFLHLSCVKLKDTIPTIITPIGFGIHQHHKVSTQLLQEFDENSLVFVHHIPGRDKSIRYLYFTRCGQWQQKDGRRTLTWSIVIADSEANCRIRSAEGEEDNVEWVTEGGMHTTLTEVNETSIDVEFDRWGTFHTNEHAEYMMSQWAQYATWWEQSVAPARLIL
ncbi:hypothetical protein PHMEG_0008279 [Phytophthora megakarya]|uniref:Uncharacterized protein n=1 Tax=Phytophthora megakarya TaxID=4795 RepID=A0A225WKG0_9STRA|nr:hypothetical protein PHMEG_0008279 [Phytophthora megakarya]